MGVTGATGATGPTLFISCGEFDFPAIRGDKYHYSVTYEPPPAARPAIVEGTIIAESSLVSVGGIYGNGAVLGYAQDMSPTGNGAIQTVAGQLVNCKEPTGTTGATGPTGKEGATGATGGIDRTGATGATGKEGVKGATGVTGSTGSTGATGPAGTGIVGGGIGGAIGFSGFNMSLYAQTAATPMIVAGTLRNFTVHFTANVSTNTVLVVQKNGASTTITCTVAKNTSTCSDNTHTVAFAASDTILVHASYPGGFNSGTNPSWSATYP